MYKHKARMTPRRFKILQLMAKGYTNEKIAKELNLTKSHYNLQRWRLYCYLGEVHKPMDAVRTALQIGLLQDRNLSEKIREEIYGNSVKQTTQIFYYPEREQYKLMYV